MSSLKRTGRLLLAALCLHGGATLALPEDRDQPIHVVADNAVQENGTVTYRGDVVITQGSLRITGARVIVKHVDGRVQRLDSIGAPATFRQQPDAGGAEVSGRGQHLIYFQTENRVELLEKAFVERGGNSVAGNRIEYLVDTDVVRADGRHANQPGRVEMVLQPSDAPPQQPGDASSRQAPAAGQEGVTGDPAADAEAEPQRPDDESPSRPAPAGAAEAGPASDRGADGTAETVAPAPRGAETE